MDTKKLDLNLLVTLEALLSERNVTRAAERLGLSQPAVSAQLVRLRDLFGDQLLVPAQRGMVPTPRALALSDALSDALTNARRVVTHGVAFDPKTEELKVTIAATDVVQYSLLMPFAVSLLSSAPGIRLALQGYDVRSVERRVEAGEIDLAITRPGLAPDTFRTRKLQSGDYVLIARRDHPVVRQSITLEQFLSLGHVITEPDKASFSGQSDKVLKDLGRRRNIVISVSNFFIAAEIVARTDLISMVPAGITINHKDRLQIMHPPIEIPGFELVLVWHQRTHDHAGLRWVREALVETVKRG